MSYYISPRFLDKLSIHITKNYLNLPSVKVPLILGVHGRKGEGKSFQCELVFDRMGVEAVHMSAGELESPDAGDPARLIRIRYREAAELVKVRGRMAVLMINDIDAGAGRVDQYTQYTVNTQLVNGTLMNIADNPTNVQLPGSYEIEPIQRIPIIVTGNDFSTLYQPLIRDGRMDKFFWEPNRDDRIGVVNGIFQDDRIARSDIETLVDTFPDQAIDFYGALRSRLYDEQVKALIEQVGLDHISQRVVNSAEAPPEFRKPNFGLPHLIEVGQHMVQEQRRVQEMGLAEEYNKSLYFNRKLGDTNAHSETPHSQDAQPKSFFRAYDSSGGNGQSNPAHSESQPRTSSNSSYAGQPSSNKLTPDVVTQVNQILGQGHRLGIEYVDDRRFRTNSWTSYGTFQGDGAQAIAALESCLTEHGNDYVRVVGIAPKDRRRVAETIVHRPNGKH
ncbi:ribulose bisphosphate carboxylase small subunit [Leptolyngbya sp. FACHB-36]|uniref:ribulose bisphosphate carboxylase small subunit n=1 Tax=Leptolyngbya sp. FACHB-36 TaxID=2692808 RepID=UPI0016812707|nr:ribulose bisphosphate carboxylase small subunit [Leptolyngbya sp. FACHB-36]MBD2022355.1 ribulose bisphosphate carboxylase small subunit [Leptolyngbya sp. FACHB-36]